MAGFLRWERIFLYRTPVPAKIQGVSFGVDSIVMSGSAESKRHYLGLAKGSGTEDGSFAEESGNQITGDCSRQNTGYSA